MHQKRLSIDPGRGNRNQDATAHQVGYMRPEFKGDPLQMEVHKLQGNRQSGAKWKRQQPQIPGSNDQPHKTDSNDQKQTKSKEKVVSTVEQNYHTKSECPAKKAKCFKCGKEGHYGSVCRSKRRDARVNELQAQSATAPKSVNCVLDEYQPVYFKRLFITSRQ